MSAMRSFVRFGQQRVPGDPFSTDALRPIAVANVTGKLIQHFGKPHFVAVVHCRRNGDFANRSDRLVGVAPIFLLCLTPARLTSPPAAWMR